MGYNIAIIDHPQRFSNSREFLAWYDSRHERPMQHEDHMLASPSLQQWFLKMKDKVRPLNGEFAPPDDELGNGEFPEAEYVFSEDMIYVELGWTDYEKTRALAFNLAKEFHLAYFDISGNISGSQELHNADGSGFVVSRKQACNDGLKEEYKKISQKQDKISLYVYIPLGLFLIVCILFYKTWGIYAGILTFTAMATYGLWEYYWDKRTKKRLWEKYTKEYQEYKRQMVEGMFMSIEEYKKKATFHHVTEEDIFREGVCVQDIIDPVWYSVNLDDYETFQKDTARFTKEQIYIFAVQWYSSEVSNGGHYQFFINSIGILWKEAIAGLQAIRVPRLAENLQKACDRFTPHPPFEQKEREAATDALDYNFDEEDKVFFNNEHYIEPCAMKYIRANAQAFVL